MKEEEASSVGRETVHFQFGVADWAVFVLMLVVSVVIGVLSAVRDRRRATTHEYLLGGRSMPPLAVGLSLLGGWISAISILGNATEIYFHGTQLTTSLLGIVPGILVLHQIIIPILYNLKIYSINEYLERRFRSVVLRKLATIVNLIVSIFFMGMCLHTPSLALATVTSISPIASMVIMGVIVTVYITIGGVKAVVYTDVLQALLMFVGVLAVVVLSCIELGGVGEVWATAERGGRLEFFNFDTNPYVRHTLLSTICLGFFTGVNDVGLNQSTYQRLASVSSLSISKRLVWFFLVGLWCLWSLFFFSGLVAYATYSICDPLTSGKITNGDQIIPFLVIDKLGHIPGVSGVFVAAAYGGMLSTLSSSGNSMACMVWEDFLKPLSCFRGLSDSSALHVIRVISSFTGLVAVASGLLMSNLGNVFHVLYSVVGTISGPIKGAFLASMLLPWVNDKGAFVGVLVSLSYSVWIFVGKFLKGGGEPSRLPLSVDGCPAPVNDTQEVFTSTILPLTTDASTTTLEQAMEEKNIYDISYCYNGVTAILITMVVSGVVALLTGPTNPRNLECGVVNSTSYRLYMWQWQCYRKRKNSHSQEDVTNEAEEDAGTIMMPPTKNDTHNTQ